MLLTKVNIKVCGLLLGILWAHSVFAEWDVSSSRASVAGDSFFQVGVENNDMFSPSATTGNVPTRDALSIPSPVYAISISGSLKQNLERIFKRYHWKMVWKAPYDYNFDGRVSGASVPDVMEQLLKMFPLQAIMYMSNKTILIIPRHKQYD